MRKKFFQQNKDKNAFLSTIFSHKNLLLISQFTNNASSTTDHIKAKKKTQISFAAFTQMQSNPSAELTQINIILTSTVKI